MGWSESAMIAGARDVGVSPAIVGAFQRKEAALVEVPTIPLRVHIFCCDLSAYTTVVANFISRK
jgi:hypothetical protein